MGSGVSSVEDDACRRVHVLVDPASPCLERSPVGLRRVELGVQRVAFFVVVLPASIVQESKKKILFEKKRIKG